MLETAPRLASSTTIPIIMMPAPQSRHQTGWGAESAFSAETAGILSPDMLLETKETPPMALAR